MYVYGDMQLTGSNVTLADQVPQPVGWASTLRINIWGTTFDVQIQGRMYDGQWYTLTPDYSPTGNSLASDITTNGVYDFDVAGWKDIQLKRVSGTLTGAQGALLP